MEWISINKRLPEKAGNYIICDHYGNVMSRHFCKGQGKFSGYWHLNGSKKYGNPTHWMPMPEPPDERAYRRKGCADPEEELLKMLMETPELIADIMKDLSLWDFQSEARRKMYYLIENGAEMGLTVNEEQDRIEKTAERVTRIKGLAVRMRINALLREKDALIKNTENADWKTRLETMRKIDDITKKIRSYKGKVEL